MEDNLFALPNIEAPNTETFEVKIRYHASAAERWFNCHKSLYLAALLPKEESSIYAAEGTVAHKLAETAIKSLNTMKIQPADTLKHYEAIELRMLTLREKNLKDGKPDPFIINQEGHSITINEEMFNAVENYLLYIAKWLEEERTDWGAVKVENKLPILKKKNFIGTLDAYFESSIPFSKNIHIFDLKYGKGKFVSGKDNLQLKIYALGLFEKLDFDQITAHIIQPRILKSATDSFSQYSKTDMLEFKKFLSKKLREIEKNPDVCKQGDWCNWCPAKAQCPLLNAIVSDPNLLNLNNKTPEGYKKVWETCLGLEKQIKEVKEQILDYAIKGGEVEGYIVAPGKTTRKWTDPNLAESLLIQQYGREKVMEPEVLKSPAVLEKEIGKPAIEPYVSYVSSSKTLKKKDSEQKELETVLQSLN